MTLSKKKVAILLSQLEGFENPKPHLEQYETDGESASVLWDFAFEDVQGKKVADLGSGTGILSFACALAQADIVVGFELDRKAILKALQNKKTLEEKLSQKLPVFFVQADVRQMPSKSFDVCVMNPPFGIQRKGADREFLKSAFRTAPVIWSFLSKDSTPFVIAFAREFGFELTFSTKVKIHLKGKMFFHRAKVKFIEADLYRLEKIS